MMGLHALTQPASWRSYTKPLGPENPFTFTGSDSKPAQYSRPKGRIPSKGVVGFDRLIPSLTYPPLRTLFWPKPRSLPALAPTHLVSNCQERVGRYRPQRFSWECMQRFKTAIRCRDVNCSVAQNRAAGGHIWRRRGDLVPAPRASHHSLAHYP